MVDQDSSTETELAIIGAGPGGYVAAIRAGQLDLDVTLIEAESFGGVCLNHGCIPSKALITASDLAYEAGHAEEMGVYADPAVDVDELFSWKDDVVNGMTRSVQKLCRANGVDLLEGRAEFVDERTLAVTREGDTDPERVSFENAIIAPGSRPIEIPGFEFDGERVLSSRDVLSLAELPERVVVVGAGYIGMELSTVLAKLDVEVTVVEMLEDVMPGFESDLTRPVRRRASEIGIDLHFGEAAHSWAESDEGIVVRTEDEEGEITEFQADATIVAVGRRAVTDTVNLDAIGLEPNDAGFLDTDDQARTELEHVFAIGDVAGEPMLAHKASREGLVAAEVIAGEDSTLDYQAVPAAAFTDPEIATVGMTESDASEAGLDPVVGEFPFQAGGRAPTTGRTDGFVRLVADGEDGPIVGAQIVGQEAAELIAELGLAIEMGATFEEVASAIHTHPTLSEAAMEAAEHGLGRAIHRLNR